MNERFWRLIINYVNGESNYLVGTEELIRMHYNDVSSALISIDGTVKAIAVQGLSDTVDRSVIEFTLLVEHLRSVGLVEL